MKNYLLFLFILFISCNKEPEKEILKSNPYYMSAYIDGKTWKVTGFEEVRFSTNYDYDDNRFEINIHAGTLSKAQDKMILIGLDFTPSPGKYYFNNEGGVCIENGVYASYIYWDDKHNDHAKWSNSGFVDIKMISRDSISGFFSFTAKGDASNPELSYIDSGKFNAFYGRGNGAYWPGPQK